MSGTKVETTSDSDVGSTSVPDVGSIECSLINTIIIAVWILDNTNMCVQLARFGIVLDQTRVLEILNVVRNDSIKRCYIWGITQTWSMFIIRAKE